MSLLYYSEAISTLTRLHDLCPDTPNAEIPKHTLLLAINAFADCLNREIGFKEPDRPICDCGKHVGPRLGDEEEFYRAHPIPD